jgi:hypothetical protein
MKAAKHRKTKITIETERVWVLERPGAPKGWCPACSKLVNLVFPEEVAALANAAQSAECPIKLDQLHFIGTTEGLMVVCADSLSTQIP